MLIKGGWQLAGGHGAIDRERAIDDMFAFADAGIRAFDCADIYTGVESLIGEFLQRHARERPEAERVRVHTKCVPDLALLPSLAASDLEAIVDRSRARLGVDTIDLVQFHWWDFGVPGYVQAAQQLDGLRRRGKIHELGATNFDVARLTELLDAGVPIVSHQVQYSLLDRRPAGAMASLCTSRGVRLLAYGALAGGFLDERWLGVAEPDEPLENRSLVKYRLIIDEFGGWPLFQELLHVLTRVAARHGVRIGTVALRWVLDQPGVAAAIVGARNTRHLGDTVAALSLPLSGNDHAELREILDRSRGPAGEVYGLERDREGTHGRIMRYNLNRA